MVEWSIDRVRNVNGFDFNIFLKVLAQHDGKPYQRVKIVHDLIDNNYIKSVNNSTTEQEKMEIYGKLWESYVGPINSYGIAFIGETFRLSPVAKAYLNQELSYSDFMRLQLTKFQIPNGSIKITQRSQLISEGILVKPFIITLKSLVILFEIDPLEAWLDKFDVANHLQLIKTHSQIEEAVQNILRDRTEGKERVTEKKADIDILINAF